MKNLSNQTRLIFAQMNENKGRFVYEVGGGRDWHKEVSTIDDTRDSVRNKFYTDRAKLKNAIGENIKDIPMARKKIDAKGGYLFGALKESFGKKGALKILKLAENAGVDDGVFNVDKFNQGDTVSVDIESDGGYLVKRSKKGEVKQKVKIYNIVVQEVTPTHPSVQPFTVKDSCKNKEKPNLSKKIREEYENSRGDINFSGYEDWKYLNQLHSSVVDALRGVVYEFEMDNITPQDLWSKLHDLGDDYDLWGLSGSDILDQGEILRVIKEVDKNFDIKKATDGQLKALTDLNKVLRENLQKEPSELKKKLQSIKNGW